MRAWGITDGSAGMMAQVRALAEAMHMELEEKTVTVNPPWQFLPNMALDAGLAKLFPVVPEIPGAWPDVIISCGRKGALVSASLAGEAKRIHIQDPQMWARNFDVVIAMEHDKIGGGNVIKIPYALHNITIEKLMAAQAHWEPKFAHLPRPWNAVLIGGSTNKYRFTKSAMQQLIREIEQVKGSLLITSSRRTGDDNIALLAHHFGGHNDRVFLYTGELENPYPGMLACADNIYVTNDSVNMMSEAKAAGKPVHILKLQGHENTKPARFAETLYEKKVSPRVMMQELAVSVRQMLA